MKYTVEMTETELKDYLKFKEQKTKEEAESNRYYLKWMKLKDAVRDAILVDVKAGTFGFAGDEEVKRLLNLAGEFN